MTTYTTMNLLTFQKQFATEEACHDQLFQLKWPNGFACEKCDHQECYVTNTRKLKLYECKDCRYQSTVTVGTIMEKTRTDLSKWFLAIYLVASDKRGVSAMKIAKEVEVTYKTAWLMLHKIRRAMKMRDANYKLAGIVEMDDALFGAPREGGKRGRGTKKTKVLIGLSLNRKGHPLFLKMEVVPNIKSQTLIGFAERHIQDGSVISSDAYHSYRKLEEQGYTHEYHVYNPKKNPDHLRWLHTVLSNAKALVGGAFHGLGSRHLQAYLDEFCYRFNRRRHEDQLFSRLLHHCVGTKTITHRELVRS
ncbi:IS1595 family transposase [Alteribacter keqinensis]|uniref:IS1595 family transposase n=1 Tax=Alteribacter keqinensis TaxID=2483800 RepID=A0A3M7TM52_9BACI|nr:IS1595 family transposase [Alteribacter keqinensis]RNA66703.1 IS1595 family transposase [Alteribacter keqinensis]